MRTALRRLADEAPALQDTYRAALPELISRDNWSRLYSS
jgi:galactofuranosylgalactofuranosylrhamnosyl-N-acetylglucosaminyl-diphospho-decaprenol beta-1,5/1,6-galactofuranosyltransferase